MADLLAVERELEGGGGLADSPSVSPQKLPAALVAEDGEALGLPEEGELHPPAAPDRAEAVSGDAMADQLGDHAMGVPTREDGAEAPLPFVGNKISHTNDYEECLSCQ